MAPTNILAQRRLWKHRVLTCHRGTGAEGIEGGGGLDRCDWSISPESIIDVDERVWHWVTTNKKQVQMYKCAQGRAASRQIVR